MVKLVVAFAMFLRYKKLERNDNLFFKSAFIVFLFFLVVSIVNVFRFFLSTYEDVYNSEIVLNYLILTFIVVLILKTINNRNKNQNK